MENNRIAIYARISTNKQNICNQIIELKKYAEERNLTYDIYTDVESSKNTRPTKNMLLNEIRNSKKYDSILVWCLDRWARNSMELLQNIHELLKLNVNFISINDKIDIKNIGIESIKLLSSFYEFELKCISERTKLGLERAKQEGKKLGRPHGSKDKLKRPKMGYFIRESVKRRDVDEAKGIRKSLSYYFSHKRFSGVDEVENLIRSDIGRKISNGKKIND